MCLIEPRSMLVLMRMRTRLVSLMSSELIDPVDALAAGGGLLLPTLPPSKTPSYCVGDTGWRCGS